MTNVTVIPRSEYNSHPGPCWIPIKDSEGQWCRPLIRCQCGKYCGISLHHVHADGRVTASFFDSDTTSFVHKGKTYSHEPGCGFHVYLKLSMYDCGEFLPEE